MHAILETARGVANVEEICGASPRMQGLSLGPADLAADRRMKTTRVGGGHPGYLVRQDPATNDEAGINADRTTYQQDLWHYTIARMVDACAMHGIYPYYGPFGDIADVVACEDQFRNAFLLGCVGTWSLHPKQIAIANRVFSPSVEDITHARRVVAAMGDGTGAVMLDGKMEDDASLKQCLVMVRAGRAAGRDRPRAEEAVRRDPEDGSRHERLHAPALGALHAELQRAGAREGQDPARRRPHLRPRGRRRPGRQAGRARGRLLPPPRPASTATARSRSGSTASAPSGTTPTSWPRRRPARTASSCPRSTAPTRSARLVAALERAGAPDHTRLWAMVETPEAIFNVRELAAASDRLAVLVMGTNDLVKELYAEHVPGRAPLLTALSLSLLAARAAGVAILDGVYNDVKNTDGFLAECQQGREMGFDGKTLIHPGQVEGANEAFAPVRAGGRGRPRHARRPGRPARAPASSPTTAGWSRTSTSSPPSAP